MINIGGDSDDKSFRYKMPAVLVKLEGSGNGTKTILRNIVSVAGALDRPLTFLVRFIKADIGSQTLLDKKRNLVAVNGRHEAQDIQTSIGKFIEAVVLCPRCRLPESRISTPRGSSMQQKKIQKGLVQVTTDCAACGFRGPLLTMDTTTTALAKLKTFIIKSGEVMATGQENEYHVAHVSNFKKHVYTASSTEWFTDTSKEARQARRRAEFGEVAIASTVVCVPDADDEHKASVPSPSPSPASWLREFMLVPTRTVDEICEEVRRLKIRHGMGARDTTRLTLEGCLGGSRKDEACARVRAHAGVLSRFASDPAVLLACVEELVRVTVPSLVSRTPMILQALYETDVVGEEDVNAWFGTQWTGDPVRTAAEVFVSWLASAEEEDEDEDQDDVIKE